MSQLEYMAARSWTLRNSYRDQKCDFWYSSPPEQDPWPAPAILDCLAFKEVRKGFVLGPTEGKK